MNTVARMKTFKVYFRIKGTLNQAFVDARTETMATRRIRRRYPHAAVQTLVEL